MEISIVMGDPPKIVVLQWKIHLYINEKSISGNLQILEES